MIEITSTHEAALAANAIATLKQVAETLRQLDGILARQGLVYPEAAGLNDYLMDQACDIDFRARQIDEALNDWQAIQDHGSEYRAYRAENPSAPR